MGDPSRQLADGFHLLSLEQLGFRSLERLFRLFPLGHVQRDVRDAEGGIGIRIR